MKKTVKTAMTAAMFAATLGAAAGTASAVQSGEYTAVPLEPLLTATAGTAVCVYGPPEVMESLFGTETTVSEPPCLAGAAPVITQTTAEDDPWGLRDEGVAPIMTDELITAGEVPVPTVDLNYDGSFDSRDLTIVKRLLLDPEKALEAYPSLDYLADFDYNGTVDKQDIIQMILKMTGMPEWKPEEAITTTTMASAADVTTTEATVMTEPIPQPAYGPPEWFE